MTSRDNHNELNEIAQAIKRSQSFPLIGAEAPFEVFITTHFDEDSTATFDNIASAHMKYFTIREVYNRRSEGTSKPLTFLALIPMWILFNLRSAGMIS